MIGSVRQGDGAQPGLLRQERPLVGQVRAVALGHDLLKADDVGAELAQHRADARRVVAPIGADAGVDIVGGDDQAWPAGVRCPGLGRHGCARAPMGDALERFSLPLGNGAQALLHVSHPRRVRTKATRSA